MNILQINKFHFINGGADKYYFDISNILETRGHRATHFSMEHPRNQFSPHADYFVSFVDFGAASKNILLYMHNVGRAVWSFKAQKKLNTLLAQQKIDVAHVHNIYHQLSPSILYTLKQHGIPMVMTVHDWNLISCNYVRYHHGEICSHALNKNYFNAVRYKCVNGLYTASLLKACAQYAHKLTRAYSRYIDVFIFPSHYMAAEHIRAGFPMKQYNVIPNFVGKTTLGVPENPKAKKYIICVGRLSQEKGVDVLIDAYVLLRKKHGKECPGLLIVGDGEERKNYESRIMNQGISRNIELVGYKEHSDVLKLIQNSLFVVFPSRALENMPLAILEAMACGKPVVASRIGGVPELVEHQENGLLFEPGNIQELAEQILFLVRNFWLIGKYGKSGREKAEEYFSTEKHYERIMGIYRSLMGV